MARITLTRSFLHVLFSHIFTHILKSEVIYRQLSALMLFAAILAQTFSKSFVMADYYANTSKYAKICENKARPEMHCNGKCQMMKKLQQEEKKDQESPERKLENNTEIIVSTKSFFATVSAQGLIIIKPKRMWPSSEGNPIDRSFDILRPPQAISINA